MHFLSGFRSPSRTFFASHLLSHLRCFFPPPFYPVSNLLAPQKSKPLVTASLRGCCRASSLLAGTLGTLLTLHATHPARSLLLDLGCPTSAAGDCRACLWPRHRLAAWPWTSVIPFPCLRVLARGVGTWTLSRLNQQNDTKCWNDQSSQSLVGTKHRGQRGDLAGGGRRCVLARMPGLPPDAQGVPRRLLVPGHHPSRP